MPEKVLIQVSSVLKSPLHARPRATLESLRPKPSFSRDAALGGLRPPGAAARAARTRCFKRRQQWHRHQREEEIVVVRTGAVMHQENRSSSLKPYFLAATKAYTTSLCRCLCCRGWTSKNKKLGQAKSTMNLQSLRTQLRSPPSLETGTCRFSCAIFTCNSWFSL